MILFSIDPGTGGAIAIFRDGKLDDVVDIPNFDVGKGLVVDFVALNRLFSQYKDTSAVVEDVWAVPAWGSSGSFKFGKSLATIHCALQANGIPFTLIKPREWQKQFGIKGDQKDLSRMTAIRLFPHKKEAFARKKDHNRSDSVLIGQAFISSQPKA